MRYYRAPPVYFRGWRQEAAPHWDEHWGESWAHQRTGWDRVSPGSVPATAPLPAYQQQYWGKTYPSYEQQRSISHRNYSYQPNDPVVRQHYRRYEAPVEKREQADKETPHDKPPTG